MKCTRQIVIVLVCLLPFSVFSQEGDTEANTLENQYYELKDASNNYQIYKVVKETRLDAFWASVADTLKKTRSEISNLKAEVKSLKQNVASLEKGIAERDTSLSNQAYMIEHMDFLGMDMTKTGYTTLTWSIIFILIIGVIILYYRYNSANRVTRSIRKDFSALQEEFEEHKKRTRERETKLKRDLQTEINLVEELKTKLGEA
jgi:hypothetical protein